MTSSIICLVPRLPPSIDGLGNYAVPIVRQLQKLGLSCTFIVADPAWIGASTFEGCPVIRLPAQSQAALYQTLRDLDAVSSTVWLHYVPHAYAKRACPHWLIQGLKQWKSEQSSSHLVTMFHELYAFGLPVLNMKMPLERTGIKIVASSDFWLSPVQQHLMAQLARLSDHCFTNRQGNADILRQVTPVVQVLPVISTIGEVPGTAMPNAANRQPRLIVFGQPRVKARAYQESRRDLEEYCLALGIEEIWDIGPSTGITPTKVGNVPLLEMGRQNAEDISQILSQSLAGFVNYPLDFLGRSGIFAAYAAHGVVPLLNQGRSLSADGLVAGTHYLQPKHLRSTAQLNLPDIAIAAFDWYAQHNLNQQAKVFAHVLSQPQFSIV